MTTGRAASLVPPAHAFDVERAVVADVTCMSLGLADMQTQFTLCDRPDACRAIGNEVEAAPFTGGARATRPGGRLRRLIAAALPAWAEAACAAEPLAWSKVVTGDHHQAIRDGEV